MSDAEVTRYGLRGVRPGREARSWAAGQGNRRREPSPEHPGESYYGRPIINPPV